MDIIYTKESIEQQINTNKMVLVYFGSKTCGVCIIIKPRIEAILAKYPNINSLYIDVEACRDIAASYSMFTVPGILLFVEGKETIREVGYINIKEIDNRISRYHGLLLE